MGCTQGCVHWRSVADIVMVFGGPARIERAGVVPDHNQESIQGAPVARRCELCGPDRREPGNSSDAGAGFGHLFDPGGLWMAARTSISVLGLVWVKSEE